MQIVKVFLFYDSGQQLMKTQNLKRNDKYF